MDHITIENWQRYIPESMWLAFINFEAESVKDLVQAWLESDNDPELRNAAHQARTNAVRQFIINHDIDTSVPNLVPSGLLADSTYRAEQIQNSCETAKGMIAELPTDE